jgi:hypothetical protein
MQITTKYSIGEVVYFASTVTKQMQRECPDCLGEKKWKAASPAGGEYSFDCPRCSGSYVSDRDLSLRYTQFTPTAARLTIGSVRLDTANKEVQYMCVETGIGSGSLYDEDRLFATEKEAMDAAAIISNKANESVDWVVEQYNKTLSISDYQLKDARLRLANEEFYKFKWKVRDFLSEVAECDTLEEIKTKIDECEI